jgi:hypothetical protein
LKTHGSIKIQVQMKRTTRQVCGTAVAWTWMWLYHPSSDCLLWTWKINNHICWLCINAKCISNDACYKYPSSFCTY